MNIKIVESGLNLVHVNMAVVAARKPQIYLNGFALAPFISTLQNMHFQTLSCVICP